MTVTTIGDDAAPSLFYLDPVGNDVYDVRVSSREDLLADNSLSYQVSIFSFIIF